MPDETVPPPKKTKREQLADELVLFAHYSMLRSHTHCELSAKRIAALLVTEDP